MKIVISTIGRFHLFGLAQEMEKHGALDRIYSGYPWRVLRNDGVAKSKVTTFPYVRLLEFAAYRSPLKNPYIFAERLLQMSCVLQDYYVSHMLPQADIFVGHEAVGLVSGRAARRRGMRYVCDRGCPHAQWRVDLLNEEYDRVGLRKVRSDPLTLERELMEYEEADRIAVPSEFARRSFVESGVAADKLWTVPYGVNVGHFKPVDVIPHEGFRILFVGNLAVRKGAHDLFRAYELCDVPNKSLTIIGTVSAELKGFAESKAASDPRIALLGARPSSSLPEIYSSHDVFVLPSIEDGFGLVMAEAMACGCPVIATRNTGAPDLYEDGVEGFIVDARDPEALAARMTELARDADRLAMMSAAALDKTKQLSGWTQYGQAMYEKYQSIL